jgi:FkbM family methyltransferase
MLRTLFEKIARPKTVKRNIAGFSLRMPASHPLPEYLARFPHYNSNLGRIAHGIQSKHCIMSAIDVGANIGDSVAILRAQSQFPVLCIEGSDHYFEFLSHNARSFPDIRLEKAILGERDETIALELVEESGTGRMVPGKETQVKTLSTLVRNKPPFEKAKLVKIDTDGYDCRILRGAYDFIVLAKPVLFFEYTPALLALVGDDGISTLAHLSSLGYRHTLVYDKFGVLEGSLELDDWPGVEAMHRANSFDYQGGPYKGPYVDLCAFHDEDSDLFGSLMESEHAHFTAA